MSALSVVPDVGMSMDEQLTRAREALEESRSVTAMLQGRVERLERMLAGTEPRVQRTRTRVTDEQVRDAVVRLGRFQPGRLARELGASAEHVRPRLRDLVDRGVLRAEGHTRSRFYEYVPPADAGEAFKAQQRLGADAAPSGPRGGAAPVAGTGRGPAIADKEMDHLRRVAESAGFSFRRTGPHWVGTRPGSRPLTIPCTPGDWRAIHNLRAEMRRHGIVA